MALFTIDLSFSVDGKEMLFAADSAVQSIGCPAGILGASAALAESFFIAPVVKHLLDDISLTISSSHIYFNISRDFSIACDPLAQAGLCISLLGQGIAERNWQELMDCRLNFSVCGTTLFTQKTRKQEKNQIRTTFKAEKFTAARRARRQEVLRL
jgi:hypothetical protein